MSKQTESVTDKKAQLLSQIKKIQSKIDGIESQRLEKINKLVKKFQLLDLSDEILAREFLLIKEKYVNCVDVSGQEQNAKKN